MTLHSVVKYKSQKGAALLALALILIIGSTYALVNKLNSATLRVESYKVTNNALNGAKSALLGWALSHPVYPGVLPMPDRNGDSNYDGDSDCFNGTISNSLLLGKIPWRDYPSPTCKDSGSVDGLRISVIDYTGQQLWYAVSKNLVYESPDYPDFSLSLLDKTTDWITVRDQNGIVISDRVAFVVIAPGSVVASQDRSGTAPAASNYLDSVTVGGTCSGGTVTGGTTYNNSDTDQDYIIYPDSDLTNDNCDSFNDLLVFVTIDELMEGIKKRVLSEVSNVLTAYHNNYGALPWLSPYSDPKADSRILYGTHTGSDNASSLTDSTTDFRKWGVKKGDIVRNVTDGSLSVVTVDNNSTTLTVTGIHLGTDNDFDTDDEYYVVARDLGKKLNEQANISSTGSTLVDDNQGFVKLDIEPGDIIDNFTDGSSGIVETVAADSTITVRDLSGGTDNDFDNSDEYLVRSYAGESTIGSSGLLLEDDRKNFTIMGVSVGDVIVNLRDGSIGRVASLTQTNITADSMNFGLENLFDNNDDYILPQFYGIEGTRKGLLSFHREGGYFPSSFDIDWNIPELISATANATVSLNTPGTHTDYINNLKQFVQTSSGTSGTITVDIDEGTCIWTLPEIVECKGTHTKYDPVQGQLTSGSNTAIVTDNTKDFVTLGINPGDIVQNYDDESLVYSRIATAGSNGTTLVDSASDFTPIDPIGLYNYLVRNTSYAGPNKAQGILAEINNATTLNVNDYPGWDVDPVTFTSGDNYSIYTPAKTVISAVATTTLSTNRLSASAPDFDTQEFYRVKSATGKLTSTATVGSIGTTLTDTGQTFTADGIQSGDVVRNVIDSSWGEITAVTATTLTATLYDSVGTTTTFDVGDSYEVYYAYMNSRRYEFRLRFNGTTVTGAVNGSRKRDVCLGYTNCTGSASNVSLPFYNLGSSGTATAGSSGLLLEDDPGTPNFDQLRIHPGHVVVNSTDGSNGIITTRDSTKKVSVDELNDGTENDFDSGESFYITAPVVTIKDYDASENELSSATVSIPSGGALGSIKVSNIDYYLRETTNELPNWFIKNKWYQYVYIAYSAGEAPGAGAVCTAGTDCLELNIGANTKNDIRAMVMLTGEELSNQSWTDGTINDYYDFSENTDADDTFKKSISNTVTGSATAGSSGTTLEDTDRDFNNLGITAGYIVHNITDSSSGVISSVGSATTLIITLSGGTDNDFDNGDEYEIVNNDGIRVAVSCPSDNTKLCWSN